MDLGYHRDMEPTPALAIDLFDGISVLEGAKLKKFEDGFLVGETTSRDKISGQSKRLAHELLVIDHSDPEVTVKYHYVQEYDAAGRPVGAAHEHRETFPAKRRPRR